MKNINPRLIAQWTSTSADTWLLPFSSDSQLPLSPSSLVPLPSHCLPKVTSILALIPINAFFLFLRFI